LPVLDGIDPHSLTVAPSNSVERLLAAMAGEPAGDATHDGNSHDSDAHDAGSPDGSVKDGAVPGSGGTLLRLVGLARVVLPRLVASYTRHQRRAEPIADAAVMRALRLVVDDEVDAWRAAELHLQTLLHRASDVVAITGHQGTLEAHVAEGGPGLVRWADPGPARTDAARDASS
jgi:hypothetical protein